MLDGEVVAFGPDSRPDFALLAHRMHVADPATARLLARASPVRYLVFDVLWLDGESTTAASYDQRRALLESLPGVTVPESFRGAGADGSAVLTAATAAGLEGVVAKRRSAPYQAGRRSPDWVKVKNTRRQSVVVGGWEPGLGKRANRIGALLVGVADRADRAVGGQAAPFRYAGQVGTGFSDVALGLLAELLAPLVRGSPPFPDVPPEYARDAVWVEPTLVAEVDVQRMDAGRTAAAPVVQGPARRRLPDPDHPRGRALAGHELGEDVYHVGRGRHRRDVDRQCPSGLGVAGLRQQGPALGQHGVDAAGDRVRHQQPADPRTRQRERVDKLVGALRQRELRHAGSERAHHRTGPAVVDQQVDRPEHQVQRLPSDPDHPGGRSPSRSANDGSTPTTTSAPSSGSRAAIWPSTATKSRYRMCGTTLPNVRKIRGASRRASAQSGSTPGPLYAT